jgi:hypothetical protein
MIDDSFQLDVELILEKKKQLSEFDPSVIEDERQMDFTWQVRESHILDPFYRNSNFSNGVRNFCF